MKNDPVGERLDEVVMEMDTFFLILCGIAGGDEENKTTFGSGRLVDLPKSSS